MFSICFVFSRPVCRLLSSTHCVCVLSSFTIFYIVIIFSKALDHLQQQQPRHYCTNLYQKHNLSKNFVLLVRLHWHDSVCLTSVFVFFLYRTHLVRSICITLEKINIFCTLFLNIYYLLKNTNTKKEKSIVIFC